MENRLCQNCQNFFNIEQEDLNFYQKMKVPAPTFCPECRLTRRLMFRNERSLYKRVCLMCGQEKIMIFPKDSTFPVYCRECWWSDEWDATAYGKDFDFSKSFFEQYHDLLKTVPSIGIVKQGNNVNSEYTNRASDNKNSYLVFGSNLNENINYGSWINDSRDSMDCFSLLKSENCYECVDCVNCANLFFSRECNNCIFSYFLLNCRNCQNCFGCTNLRNKNYCIFNKQYSREDYLKTLSEMNLGSESVLNDLKMKFKYESIKYIVPNIFEKQSVGSTGNWLEECKNAKNAWSCKKIQDCKYVLALMDAKDCMDYCHWGRGAENIYEGANIGRQCANVLFSNNCWDQVSFTEYSMHCHSSSYLFGCFGLRKKQYCILNKQYTKEQYEILLPKIIEHMNSVPYIDSKSRVYKYGEFFPADFAFFAYNETIAQEYFPLNKEEVEAAGFKWRDSEKKNYQITLTAENIPDNIKDVPDSIINEVIGCAHEEKCSDQCTAAFRIRQQDLEYYKRVNLPIPRFCPNCRHSERFKQRNTLCLYKRSCMCDNKVYLNSVLHSHGSEPCPNQFETSYTPDCLEIVYCEKCYQQEVY